MFPDVINILVGDRKESAMKVNEILAKYGCNIQTRVGMHEATKTCSNVGFIVLQMTGEMSEHDKMLEELNSIEKVKAQRFEMDLD